MGSKDVQDEWDWPADCQAQREMESHLRCQICGDFFHGPVLLPCSHTFCSTCVRRFLQSKGAQSCCPQCKNPCTCRELVPNRALEQVVLLFEQSKPVLLKRLQGTVAQTRNPPPPREKEAATGRKSQPDVPDRMPLLSYNVMRDKEVRKLLDAIHVRVPTKNREEIIQIHKEFVLLCNAQADSVNPKTTAQVRDEVVRTHYARMQQKAKADALKRTDSGGNEASPVSSVSRQMRATFDKLRQDIVDRKAGKRPLPPSTDTSSATTPSKKDGDVPSIGVWRHFCALDTSCKQEFYVNSVTHEIRLELPSQRVLQHSPANRYDDLNGVVRAVAAQVPTVGKCTDAAKAVTPLKPTGKARRVIAPAFASPETTSEVKRAPESAVVVESGENESEEALEPTGKENELDTLGKHARSEDDIDAADDSNGVTDDVEEITSKKWQCSRCTLLNEATCEQCEACGHEPAVTTTKKRLRKKMQFQSKLALS
ncbi:hypothetical protein PsorP6_009372 [Peronosclerospora sorghi]|uniref:Uncharacterized protein n=1 Tax=Peronosclerospora sorghi TaxID=230839 RepID=A0ACC0VYC4_9STRA|nr:hypothetical protein PsorP6_009372 [Peronosclerospora sorghi]